MRAIRFNYRPVRYLLTRHIARRRPRLALGRLGCLALADVDAPGLPGHEWVRVRTTLGGVCGSDLAIITGRSSFSLEPFSAYPFTFGHENVGRIEEVGESVEAWSAGDRVVVNPMLACRQRGLEPCAACSSGEHGCCRRTNDGELPPGFSIGYCPGTGGGWAPYFVAHRSQLHRPDQLPDEAAVLADPFATALRAVLLQPPADDDIVLVLGAGSVGLLTVVALRATGWDGHIAVYDPLGYQRGTAERAGADAFFEHRDDLYEWAISLPGARAYDPTLAPRFVDGGPSLVYDTVGSRSSAGDSLGLAREAGRIVMIGTAGALRADWTRLWYRRLTVAGIMVYGLAPWRGRQRDVYDVALELMPDAGLERLGLLTHIFELEDYREALDVALDKAEHRALKVAFRPAA